MGTFHLSSGDKLDDLEAKNAERHLGIIKKMDEMKSTNMV